jgi:hypothetical protein
VPLSVTTEERLSTASRLADDFLTDANGNLGKSLLELLSNPATTSRTSIPLSGVQGYVDRGRSKIMVTAAQ